MTQETNCTRDQPADRRNGSLFRSRAFRAGSRIPVLCIVLFLLAVVPAAVLADDLPDLDPLGATANYGGAAAGTVFEREPNTIQITINNNGPGNAPESVVRLTSSYGFTGTTTVPAILAGRSAIVSITDPIAIPTAGGTVTYTVTADPDGLIAEVLENNNGYTRTFPVKWNGYKGMALYRDGWSNISTYRTYDVTGGMVHSFGNSYYRSGSYGGSWTAYDVTWNQTQPYVPTGATVLEARLYLPYTWDYSQTMPDYGVVKFNGNDIATSYQTYTWDQGNFGQWGDYRYGLLTYDVTSLYQRNGINYVNFTRPGANEKLSLYGMTLLVVYSDPSETHKLIFMNDGFDLLGADLANYATNETEATAYIEYSGATINIPNVTDTQLITFVPSGDSNEGNLYMNNQLVAANVWDYGAFGQPVGEDGSPQVAVDVRDIRSYLKAEDNVIAIQSTAWNTTPCMVAAQNFLVVEYTTDPVAKFTADKVTGTSPLTIQFTDQSAHDPTGWQWDFGDSNTSADQSPLHTYAFDGTFTVTLTAINAVGSDVETKTGYITVSSTPTPVPLPGYTNPPTDPDSDGLYEDLNANNRKDYNDLQVFYSNLVWIATNEPIALFDFNGNGRIDFNDLQVLYTEMN